MNIESILELPNDQPVALRITHRDPTNVIATIKKIRELNPGVFLAEAKRFSDGTRVWEYPATQAYVVASTLVGLGCEVSCSLVGVDSYTEQFGRECEADIRSATKKLIVQLEGLAKTDILDLFADSVIGEARLIDLAKGATSKRHILAEIYNQGGRAAVEAELKKDKEKLSKHSAAVTALAEARYL